MLLHDIYFHLDSLIMCIIAAKLGNQELRTKNIYYARFFMLLAIHVNATLVLEHLENKFNCWVQNKSILSDLVRMNLNSEIRLIYPPLVHIFISSLHSSHPSISLPSSFAMETVVVLLI